MASESDGGTVVPREVSELLDRRETYRGWLSRLDEVAAEARPEVRRRVRADYQGRLADVEEELVSHLESLEDSLAERREEAQRLAEEREVTAGDLEEAELRHRVGEYGDEEWEERKEELEERLGRLDEELAEARGAVERLETILEELAAGAGAPAPGRGPAAGAESEPEAPERGAPAAGEEAGSERPSGREAAGAAGAGAEAAGEEPGREAHEDELDFLESLSLDDPGAFDSLGALLDEEAEAPGRGEEGAGEEADGERGADEERSGDGR